jgi:hypothetical protein
LDLNNLEYDHHNWSSIKEFIENIDNILGRLSRKDNDWRKMPRSRDFPFNGIELIKKWREQITDELIHQVNENISKGIRADLKRIDRLIEKMIMTTTRIY